MRYLGSGILGDLTRKMVFLSGPRQCGKTTLAQEILNEQNGLYLNFDDPDHRKTILARAWNDEQTLIVLDEIHKYSRWKNFLKGTYDSQRDRHRFLVTGSARLDIFRRGQDSLFGRFFPWRLHPFCLSELAERFPDTDRQTLLEQLLEHGGFPEPLLTADSTFTARWRKTRQELVFRQDIREIEQIRDITLLELFRDRLAERAGQLLVLANVARDLEIAPKTAAAWLAVLERSYVVFTITPYTRKISRSLLKARKTYFYDIGDAETDAGGRFENLVAAHLLKRIQFLEDSMGRKLSLHFVRDKEKRETDFLVVENKLPVLLLEAKLQPDDPRNLLYFSEKLRPRHTILLVKEGRQKTMKGYTIVPAAEFLARPFSEELW